MRRGEAQETRIISKMVPKYQWHEGRGRGSICRLGGEWKEHGIGVIPGAEIFRTGLSLVSLHDAVSRR